MDILILGAGAIGSLLGARLAGGSGSVFLYSTNRAHMEAVAGHGLAVEELDGTVKNFKLAASSDLAAVPRNPGLVLVVVKTYATREAVESVLGLCSPSTVLLTLQNGIGNWETVAEVAGKEAVLAGSTSQGATFLGPGRVRHGGNGPTYIGEVSGQASERVGRVVELFRRAGLVCEPSDNVERLIWDKLIVNVGINAITGLTGIRNGVVAGMLEAAELCEAAVEEAILVAGAKGFPMGPETVERVLGVARATARNRSSMGQDVDKKKRTEIDAINGAIVRFARESGIPTPVNQTLTRLVKILESNYGGRP